MTEFTLTTIDNPFNPYKDFDEWYSFDCRKGYFTCNLLARLAKTSFELSEKTIDSDIDDAINAICKANLLGIYKKISPNDPTPLSMNSEGGTAE